MAAYSIHLLLASLHLEDTPVSYRPPRGPGLDFTVVYNQREANQPTPFPFANFGPKWTFNWLSYVSDDPANPAGDADVYVRGGGTEAFTDFNSVTQSFAADKQSMAVLVRTSSASCEKRFPDGSKEIFSYSDGAVSFPRRIYLTNVVDPAGNATTINYDSSLRVTSIVDALGQATTFSYTLAGDSLKITKVTDPFGRFATFDYTSGQLTKITDPVGIQSQFAYEPSSDFVNALTTPYGTTNFAKGESGTQVRWLEATDPVGGKERVEYNYSNSAIPSSETSVPPGVYNSALDSFNTFYWDKKAMAVAPGDYTKARITHWLPTSDGIVSGIKHSEKRPLENRVWYTYAGQTDPGKVGNNALPISVARVLADGSTQLSQFEDNSLGHSTKVTDPVGRVTSSVYDTNNIDLLTVYQRNPAGASIDPSGANADKIANYTYNGLHEPLTSTDAAGQTTVFSYNAYGQIAALQNAKNETTTYDYGDGIPASRLAISHPSPVRSSMGTSAVTSLPTIALIVSVL